MNSNTITNSTAEMLQITCAALLQNGNKLFSAVHISHLSGNKTQERQQIVQPMKTPALAERALDLHQVLTHKLCQQQKRKIMTIPATTEHSELVATFERMTIPATIVINILNC